ncbi:MAG: acetamidase/formamidase family protein [Candidatus Accumulibacter sp.]|jgi:amidase|nr:acetamidase/formamidase family protein [Accumulibacter sp.]
MKTLLKDKVIYRFAANAPMAYFVEDGESFWVETDDCYKGQIHSAEVLRPQIDISVMDCSVGPISVEGAMPGDTLCVEVLEFSFAPQGVMVTSPGLGLLGHKITKPDTKIIPIRDGLAHFSDTIKLPLTPMIGTLGVLPAKGEIHCAVPGDHGANLDTKIITTGSKVYLPVAVKGAGLALGDMHACMGDGELSGTGIETAGKVCIRTTVYKEFPLTRPMIETGDSIYAIASDKDFREAVKTAMDDMAALLMRKKALDFPDAYRLLSATCDIQISQLVNDLLTVRIRAPKAALQIDSPL